jgi:hypothetical protein
LGNRERREKAMLSIEEFIIEVYCLVAAVLILGC